MTEAGSQDNEVSFGADAVDAAQIVVSGRNNRVVIEDGASLVPFVPAGARREMAQGPAVSIQGDDNVVEIAADARLTLNMVVIGSGNRVEIGRDCRLNGFVTVRCSGAVLRVGAGTTMVNGSLQLHERGELVIGQDCMIANQVYVSLSDIHPIYDRASGDRINAAASVHIGDHVWLGLRCMVMKGSRIGDGAVVAAGAIVSGDVAAQAVAAGVPARIVRENVEWRRDFDGLD